jgi:hypothetical protein
MGLLDDAIREHLDLKRRHGASPDEVERQEREALGTARGGAEFARPDEAAREPATGVEEIAEAPEDEAPAEEPVPAGYEEDPWLENERDEVPADEALERPAEEALERPGEEAEEGEDVLEETPEFLQETPEHDRLWFEQRPPRDFDWDK